jgi:hypothetical protein
MITISINNDHEISTQDVIDMIELVPLKTPTGIAIGAISGLIVTEDRIIVSDVNVMDYAMVFDREGRYISTVGRKGRASNEYIDLAQVALASDGDTVLLYDNYGKKILSFDLDGNFLDSTPLNFWFYSFEYVSDREIVCATYGLGGDDPGLTDSQFTDQLILFTDNDFQISDGYFPNRYQSDYHSVTPHLKKNKDVVFINPSYCDTIYNVSPGRRIKAGYHIDMSKIGGAANFDSNITDERLKKIKESRALFNGDFFEGNTFAILNISHPPQGEIKSYLYDKNNGITYLINPDFDEDRYFADANMPAITTITEDDKLVAPIHAYHILMIAPKHVIAKYDELKTLTEDSNPVLIFYSLKSPVD